jgi:hypothetical protein
MSDSGVFKREYMGEFVEAEGHLEALVLWCEYFLATEDMNSSQAAKLWKITKEKLLYVPSLVENQARQEASRLTPRGRRDIVQRYKERQ